VNNPWTALLPLVIGSAILPVQITVTVLLLRSSAGRIAAVAWVAGMTAVRLAQGVVFGLVLGTGASEAEGPDRPGAIVSTLLLVVGVLFLVSALRKLIDEPDEDAPPPRWMLMISTATPRQAFAFGAGVVAASAKLWAFTLGAIGVIAEADLGRADALALFLVFVVLAESVHISLVAFAYASPRRAGPTLDRVTELLARYNRPLMIGLGLVFGVWFLVKALVGFGVI
jgi:Sap, sulfolipid-1-addressing protein